MKIVKRLKIEDKPGYYFTDITGINNFDLKFINESMNLSMNLQSLKMDQPCLTLVTVRNQMPHIVFNYI